MMYLAEATVKTGGVAFLMIDANMIKNGGGDDEQKIYFQNFQHFPRSPSVNSSAKVHSKDDDYPPDHWVFYLDGLNFGKSPELSDAVAIRLWSWNSEYLVTGRGEAFGKYLYGVVAGKPR